MIFGRTSEVDKFFAVACKWLAFGMIGSNVYFTYGYLQTKLGVGNADLRFIAAIAVAVLITCIESAVFTALFDPSVVGKLIARPQDVIKSPDARVVSITGTAQNVALVGFCLLAALAFWFDFNASISQLKVQDTVEARIIAAVFVIGGEVLFGCQNVFLHSSQSKAAFKESSTNGTGAVNDEVRGFGK